MRWGWALCGTVALLGGFGLIALDVQSVPVASRASLVVFLGWSALVSGLLVVRARLFFVRSAHVPLPAVEHGPRVPVPGDGFDALLTGSEIADYSRSGRKTDREYVRTILSELVVTTLVLDADHTRAEAERAVRRGTWTDDRLVASFLGDDVARLPLAARIRAGVRTETLSDQVARRTIDQLERIRGERP